MPSKCVVLILNTKIKCLIFVVLANFQTFSVMREKDNLSITRTPVYTGSQCPQNTYNDVVEQKNHLTDIKNNSEMFLTIKTLKY